MDQRLRDYYIESQVNNATPGQRLVMLYDCLLERAEVAAQEIKAPASPNDFRAAAHEVSRCIKILTELSTSLNHGVKPQLCALLSDLYCFFTRQFSDALETHQPEKIWEILPLIRKLRGSWVEADQQAAKRQDGSIAIAA